MSEYVREIKIRAEVDTNKTTYDFKGTSIVDLLRWAASLDPEILSVLMADGDDDE